MHTRKHATNSRNSRYCRLLLLVVALALLAATDCLAQEPLRNETVQDTSTFSSDAMLTGDWGGTRRKLHDLGLDVALTEISEALGNTTGGTRRAALYEGRLELDLSFDFEKALGWKGLTFFANGFQIHGQGLSGDALDNIMIVSNIEALRATRLYDLWLQQNLCDGMISLRAGQIAADDEFTVSSHAAVFINSAFGWPDSLAANLPSGGPAYPLATPGLRLRLGTGEPWSFQSALFDGDPGGPGTNPNPQVRNPTGTTFNTGGGVLSMSELAYAINPDTRSALPPASYKVGFWYHSGSFPDQRYDTTGRSLADPAGTGRPLMHRGDYGVYGLIDQTLWRDPEAPDRHVAAFARFFWNPQDRNPVAWQADGGLSVKGLLQWRKDDVLGVAVSFIRMGDHASGLDRDTNFFSGTSFPVRDHESVIEVTYRAAVMPWLFVQPDFQYVLHPGGNISDPGVAGGATPIRNAAVLGLRVAVTF